MDTYAGPADSVHVTWVVRAAGRGVDLDQDRRGVGLQRVVHRLGEDRLQAGREAWVPGQLRIHHQRPPEPLARPILVAAVPEGDALQVSNTGQLLPRQHLRQAREIVGQRLERLTRRLGLDVEHQFQRLVQAGDEDVDTHRPPRAALHVRVPDDRGRVHVGERLLEQLRGRRGSPGPVLERVGRVRVGHPAGHHARHPHHEGEGQARGHGKQIHRSHPRAGRPSRRHCTGVAPGVDRGPGPAPRLPVRPVPPLHTPPRARGPGSAHVLPQDLRPRPAVAVRAGRRATRSSSAGRSPPTPQSRCTPSASSSSPPRAPPRRPTISCSATPSCCPSSAPPSSAPSPSRVTPSPSSPAASCGVCRSCRPPASSSPSPVTRDSSGMPNGIIGKRGGKRRSTPL